MVSRADCLDHLAHPALSSLLTVLRPYATIVESSGAIAARATISAAPLAGYYAEQQAEGFALLRRLCREAGPLAVLSYDPSERTALERELGAVQVFHPLLQMVFTQRRSPWPAPLVSDLGTADYPEMQQLVDLTEPGPFGKESPEFGRFVGIRHDGQLAAMGGLRMQTDRIAELTAICTHPRFRRQGLAARITAALVDRLLAERRTPFLHVAEQNRAAASVYERLGFEARRTGALMLIRPPAASPS